MTHGQQEASPQLILFHFFLIRLPSKRTWHTEWNSSAAVVDFGGTLWGAHGTAKEMQRFGTENLKRVLSLCWGFVVLSDQLKARICCFSQFLLLAGWHWHKLEGTEWGCFSFHGTAGPWALGNPRAPLPSPPATLQKNLEREILMLFSRVAPFWPFQTPTSDTSFSPTPGNFIYSPFRVRFYLAAVLSIWLFFFPYTRIT